MFQHSASVYSDQRVSRIHDEMECDTCSIETRDELKTAQAELDQTLFVVDSDEREHNG